MSATSSALQRGLVGPVAELGVDLESVEVQKAGRRSLVRVVIDRDGGVDLDLVADVSRAISDLLDAAPLADELKGPFVLEVTSPGVDRPLTEPKHWRRATGRLVDVSLKSGDALAGRVVRIDADNAVTLSADSGDVIVPITDVERAVVRVEFSRSDDGEG
jgi:ribosome maturation factor RimP